MPKRHSKSFNRSLKLNDSSSSRGFSNPSSAISDISTVTLTEESEPVPEELEEEIIGTQKYFCKQTADYVNYPLSSFTWNICR